MNGTKLRQVKYKLQHDYLAIENVVLIGAIVLCLALTYYSVVAMSKNWELTERLNSEKKTLELIKVEVEAAELQNEYYKSAEYQELAARRLMGKQLEGEHMVYLPENTDAAREKHKNDVATTEPPKKEASNVEKWLMYLFP